MEEVENAWSIFSRYDYREVIGRVESGTETETESGRLHGCRWLKMSGTYFPDRVEEPG